MTIKYRVIQLDLDEKAKDNISDNELREYIQEKVAHTGANYIYVQISSEDNPGGDNKTSDRLLFDATQYVPNARLLDPHIFGKAVQMIREVAPESRILAWAPTLYSAFLIDDEGDTVQASEDGKGECNWYKRATPFAEKTRSRLNAFFNALGHCTEELDGVMFQDDLILSDWEDISEAGRRLLNERYGLAAADDKRLNDFLSEEDSSGDDFANNRDWHQYKTSTLDNLSLELFEAFKDGYREAFPARFEARQRNDHSRLKCGRDYYSAAVTDRSNDMGDWFGQNIDTALDIYDHVVIMAYANMDKHLDLDAEDAQDWLKSLVEEANAIANKNGKNRAEKLIFKLQSVIWSEREGRDDQPISAETLQKNAQALLSAGAVNIGFYPAFETESSFDLRTL